MQVYQDSGKASVTVSASDEKIVVGIRKKNNKEKSVVRKRSVIMKIRLHFVKLTQKFKDVPNLDSLDRWNQEYYEAEWWKREFWRWIRSSRSVSELQKSTFTIPITATGFDAGARKSTSAETGSATGDFQIHSIWRQRKRGLGLQTSEKKRFSIPPKKPAVLFTIALHVQTLGNTEVIKFIVQIITDPTEKQTCNSLSPFGVNLCSCILCNKIYRLFILTVKEVEQTGPVCIWSFGSALYVIQ